MNIFEIPEEAPESSQEKRKKGGSSEQKNNQKKDEMNRLSELVMAKIEEDRQLQVAEVQQEQKDRSDLEALRKGMSQGADIEIEKVAENGEENSGEKIRQNWQKFYQEVFNLDADFSQVEIPEHEKDFTLPILMPKGLTSQQLIEKCREYFAVADTVSGEITGDFEGVIVSQRSCTQESYAVLVQDLIEAGESKLKNFSANDAQAGKFATETLKERLVHELKYFLETGKHLDLESVTICAGSRLPNGQVPTVSFFNENVLVILAAPDMHAGNCGPRLVKASAEAEIEFKKAA